MRINLLAASAAALGLAGCTTDSGGVFGREAGGQQAVTRLPPLVIPPDFGMTPPRAGEAAPATAADTRAQTLQGQFGGRAQLSASEQAFLRQAEADRAVPGIRSAAAETNTIVVEKGIVTQTILQLPEGDGQEASVSVPR